MARALGWDVLLYFSMKKQVKYVFITGGVVSSLGKGITSASLALLLKSRGLAISGLSPDGRLVEIVELPNHPYFIACQFHPEFKSRPTAPHPLFLGLVGAALNRG